MNKYIDAEKLKVLLSDLKEEHKNYKGDFHEGVVFAVDELEEDIIEYLQQERPETPNDKFVFPKFLYARTIDNKTIDVSYAPQSLGAIEYIRSDSLQQGQPEVDLEKEVEQWRHEHFKGKRDGYYSGEYLERKSQLDIARHFYKLGLNARKEDEK